MVRKGQYFSCQVGKAAWKYDSQLCNEYLFFNKNSGAPACESSASRAT